MKTSVLFATLFALTAFAHSQQSETPAQANQIANYAPYSVALVPGKQGGEVVLPFLTTENKLAFFTLSEVRQASNDNKVLGRLISYGELIALIGDLQVQVNQLKQENEKLWAAVGKPSPAQTIVVQPSSPPSATTNADVLSKYLLLRQLFPSSQRYPVPANSPRKTLNCTTRYIGTTAYTDCN